jgi:hypothetical protein
MSKNKVKSPHLLIFFVNKNYNKLLLYYFKFLTLLGFDDEI